MIKSVTDYVFLKDYIENHRELFPDNLVLINNMELFSKKLIEFGKIFVFYQNNQVPAGLIAGYMNDLNTKKSYISLLFVEREYSKNGIASQLVKLFEKKAKEMGMSYLEVKAIKNNDVAVNFYLKNKFLLKDELDNERLLFYKKI